MPVVMIDLILGVGIALTPTKQVTVPIFEKPKIVKIEKPELTLKEKIAQNVNKCKTDLEWIRADNATCKPKTLVQPKTSSQTIKSVAPVGSVAGNTYSYGYCTYFVKNMRPDLPNNLGNADTWTYRASAQGIPTGVVPRAGAVGQQGMHVVFVTGVNPDGTFNLTEMNYVGFNQISSRSSVSPAGWNFIY